MIPARLLNFIGDRLIERAKKTPYFHLDNYMERYWLVPYADAGLGNGCGPVSAARRPLAWLLQRFGIAVRVHHILRSDNDRASHNHPWSFVTVLLRGGYVEVRPGYRDGLYVGDKAVGYSAGDVLLRRPTDFHRLVLMHSCWTLFISGPKKQTWGFLPNPAYIVHWREYLKDKAQ